MTYGRQYASTSQTCTPCFFLERLVASPRSRHEATHVVRRSSLVGERADSLAVDVKELIAVELNDEIRDLAHSIEPGRVRCSDATVCQGSSKVDDKLLAFALVANFPEVHKVDVVLVGVRRHRASDAASRALVLLFWTELSRVSSLMPSTGRSVAKRERSSGWSCLCRALRGTVVFVVFAAPHCEVKESQRLMRSINASMCDCSLRR